ncbi:galactose oxidase-like domain-containing protein [Corallococcus sp. CA047B]|uniref:galactose oxidase-like domain-containing protein n=1 Tax=Corallococcus sp. CA047B TaxID=2316729 RepID=UPI001F1B6B45|nr:galactose oxidase-like domain-containing protein [Corallococcus sp. CA047B]
MLRTWRLAVLAAWAFTAAARAQALDPAVSGQWSAVRTWPYSAVHTHLLPTGKVMWFSEFGDGDNPHLWDPQTNVLTALPKAGFNIFCAGHAFLPDGRLLVAGGHIADDAGLPYATLFNPFTNTWTRLPNMNAGRWYPTVTTLPNGELLVIGGAKEDTSKNLVPQVWQPSKNAWRTLSGASLELMYYPWMFVAPNGKSFMAGYWKPSRFLSTDGTGAWTSGPRTRYAHSRNAGSAALYEPGKVLIAGGDNPPTNNVEVIDLNAATPAWRTVAPMRYVRRQHNTTLLPDGTVLVTGGHSGPGTDNPRFPRYETELWNPTSETWTELAPISAYRGYHSTTLLLPDGRVLSAGGRGVRTQQVFSPPYLFKGARPTISSAPTSVAYGENFRVTTPNAALISKVSWIRLGSVTHAFDENQRFQWLKFTASSGALTITAPTQANTAPPGHYLLFLLNANRVPSVAKIIRIGGTSSQDPTDPPPDTGYTAVAFGAEWKYDDRNVDPGAGWTAPTFNDAAWKKGPAQLGYGDGDEATALSASTPRQPSVYFRRKFMVHGMVDQARLKVLHDDGFVVWLNGTQVFSKLVNNTAHGAYAQGSSSDNAMAEATLPGARFVMGENTLAVMVKQANATSSDLSFDLELKVTTQGNAHSSLVLESPNGGETLRPGNVQTLHWMSHGSDFHTLRLQFSPDNGAHWTTVNTGIPDTGFFDWTVPSTPTSQGLLRVGDAMRPDIFDQTDTAFTISTSPKFQAVGFGEYWTFDDRGVDPGSAWMALGFDDGAWRSGPAPLGYGAGDEHTVLDKANPSQPSLYFRKKLTLGEAIRSANVRVLHDDGVALWVNGKLVYSRYMENGFAHGTFASGVLKEPVISTATFDGGPFVVGENILTVMVKQANGASHDAAFDLELNLETR